jgi:predicted acylesterase/phospholipase RssA
MPTSGSTRKPSSCARTDHPISLRNWINRPHAEAAWAAAKDVYFVDGGVLDNAPFDLVIDAIARRQAQTQVNRQLVYVEPDPGQALYAPISDKPDRAKSKRRWLKDLLAMSGVRSSHPILKDLTRLRDANPHEPQ